MTNEETIIKDQIPQEPEEMTENQVDTPVEVAAEEGNTEPQNNSNRDQEIQDLKDKYLRLLAEFENFKKRTARERIDNAKFASQELMTALLTVMDDFEREIKAGVATEGSKLIYTKMLQILKQKGLQEMVSTGEPFDAALHEAITELEAGDELKNKVIDTVEKGYYLNEKIIRYAKVVVGK
jgi:molecular chaperone GrpE